LPFGFLSAQVVGSLKGRVVLSIRLKPGYEEAFLDAYGSLRHAVAQGARGHLVDQLCQSIDDPLRWCITSEWEDLECFRSWQRSEGHGDLINPMRECWAEANAMQYVVHQETGH
jgi:heme-degrading monooxygenase HmoA